MHPMPPLGFAGGGARRQHSFLPRFRWQILYHLFKPPSVHIQTVVYTIDKMQLAKFTKAKVCTRLVFNGEQ